MCAVRIPAPNAACRYRIKAERHDFGTYYEVIARVDPSYVLTPGLLDHIKREM